MADTEMDGGNGNTQAIITYCSVVLLCLHSVLYSHGLRMMYEKSRSRLFVMAEWKVLAKTRSSNQRQILGG